MKELSRDEMEHVEDIQSDSRTLCRRVIKVVSNRTKKILYFSILCVCTPPLHTHTHTLSDMQKFTTNGKKFKFPFIDLTSIYEVFFCNKFNA